MQSIRNLSTLEIQEQLHKIYPSGVKILMNKINEGNEDQRLLIFSLPGTAKLLTIRGNKVLCTSAIFQEKMVLRVRQSFPRHQCTFLPAPYGGYYLNLKILASNDVTVLLDSLRLMEYVGQKLELLQNE